MSHGYYRLKGFDYRSNRWYFVTSITAGRAQIFGRIEGISLVASSLGIIVAEEIALLSQRRSRVQIPVSVVMPNHVHLLIGLANEGPHESPARFGQVSANSLATTIGGLKSGVTRRARSEGAWASDELWQRRYHDRIIRDQEEWEGIADYILFNPVNWHLDPLSGSREPTDEEVRDWKRRLGM